jgi:PAS domain-containing protein
LDDHVHPDDRDVVSKRCAEAIAANGPMTFEHRMISSRGETKWLRTTVRPITGSSGIQHLSGVMLDITDRRVIEQKVEYQGQLFDSLMDTLPDHIYFKDRDGRFMRVNRAQATFLGCPTPNDAVGRSDAAFFPPEHAARTRLEEMLEAAAPRCKRPDDRNPRYISKH